MTRGSPPEWGDDHFSTFFKDADYNTKACAANYPQVFQALGRVHAVFGAAVEAVEKDSNFLRLVLACCWSGFTPVSWPQFD